MERERKFKIVALVAVIIAVIGLSIAFAAMSRTLNINGSGSVDPANWDIYFTNLSSPTLGGEASVSGTPTLATKGVTISNMNVTLKKPKDSVVYTVDIKNDGDIDAEIENLVLPTFTSAQQQLFDFTVVYTNGGQAVSIGDTLAKGETRNVTITFKYKDITDESLLPSTAQQISVSYQIIYRQTNNVVTTTTQGSQYGSEIVSEEIEPGITATYYGGTPMAKAETGVVPMSNNMADDVRYSGGTLVISGTGALPDQDETLAVQVFLTGASSAEELFENEDDYIDSETDALILKYNPTNLIVGEGITSIGELSFNNINSISSIQLPSTLVEIGNDSFSSLTSLTTLRLPSGLQTIGNDAFAGCYSITTVYIPSTIVSVGSGAFYEMVSNSTIYVETQAVANLLTGRYNSSNTQVVVDPTQFQ